MARKTKQVEIVPQYDREYSTLPHKAKPARYLVYVNGERVAHEYSAQAARKLGAEIAERASEQG